MNKRIYFLFFFLVGAVSFTSCVKEYEMEYTSAELLAGRWMVSGDPYLDHWVLLTTNSKNDASKIILTDNRGTATGGRKNQGGALWNFAVTVSADPSALTFGQSTDITNEWYYTQIKDPVVIKYDIKVRVKNGKIERNAVTLPSGGKADKISFILAFEDNAIPFEEWNMVGYRISGHTEDEEFIYKQ